MLGYIFIYLIFLNNNNTNAELSGFLFLINPVPDKPVLAAVIRGFLHFNYLRGNSLITYGLLSVETIRGFGIIHPTYYRTTPSVVIYH